jgi:multimeric flavodoxin WrbA
MKVLALNSSPRVRGQSKTELMLDSLVAGMRHGGAQVELVTLREKTIRNCIGCYTCWTKTPGTCVHKDDMSRELFPKWLESDLAVYATPLYNYAMNATMKMFIERTLPALEPIFEIREGRMFHPLRRRVPAVVILSVCGMPDEGHFGPLSAHMNYYLASPGRRLAAEIYRPAAEVMTAPFFKEKADAVLEATRQAGVELAQSMTVSSETMGRITQPLVDPHFFAGVINSIWKTCIAEGVTMEEFRKKEMVPRPDSLDSFLLLFPMGINAGVACDRKVVLQFKFSGEVKCCCHFTIEKGTVEANSGTSAGPDLTIEAPFNVWADIMTGKVDGWQMLMEQKYKVSGDISLMTQLFQKA